MDGFYTFNLNLANSLAAYSTHGYSLSSESLMTYSAGSYVGGQSRSVSLASTVLVKSLIRYINGYWGQLGYPFPKICPAATGNFTAVSFKRVHLSCFSRCNMSYFDAPSRVFLYLICNMMVSRLWGFERTPCENKYGPGAKILQL